MIAQHSIEIQINGEPRTVTAGLSLAGLLHQLKIAPEQVAIERNRQIVRKEAWETTGLQSGDKLEIVQFVGGG